MKTVLVTGAAGGIGTRLRPLLKGVYPDLRLSDVKPPADLAPDENFVPADLADMAQVERVGRRRRRHRASRRLFGRRTLGDHPPGQHHRLLQPVRGGAPPRRRARRVRLVEPRGRLLSAPPPHRRRRAGAPGFALRRQQGVRRGARRALCVQARPARHLHPHRQFRRCAGRPAPAVDLAHAGGPGAAHPHRPRASRTSATRSSSARPTMRAAGGTTARPSASAIGRRAAPRTTATQALAAQAKLPPDPVGDWYQGGPFCSDEFDDGIERGPV